MNSIISKSGIIAVVFIFSHCANNTSPITTIHPLMNLAVEKQASTSRVIISTTVAKDYAMYRIIDDSCTVNYPWSMTKEDLSDSAYIASVKIANDPAASQSGAFLGIWEVPDSLFKYGSLQIYVSVSDETNHNVSAARMLYGSLP